MESASKVTFKVMLGLETASTNTSLTSSAFGIVSAGVVLLNSTPTSACVPFILNLVKAGLNAMTKLRMKRIPYLAL